MTPDQIPQKLIDILDTRAGKKHSRDGEVITTLAEILTEYDHFPRCYWCGNDLFCHYCDPVEQIEGD